MTSVRFYFDFISPYAYLAWTQIRRVVEPSGRTVEPVPVLFAALLDAHGTLGPAEIPAKRRYLLKDVARKAALFGVPVELPFAHPFNPLLALRVASLDMPPDVRASVVDSLFRAVWVDGEDVTNPEVVTRRAVAAKLEGDAVGRSSEPSAKARVRTQTDRAISEGVFGVPTSVVDGELFWGTDSLELLERYLRDGEQASPALMERWASLPTQATRRRSGS